MLSNATTAQGQSTYSTYSRFGIGLPSPAGTVTHFGMGGVSTPMVDGSLINLNNPASYSYCGITTMQLIGSGNSIKASTDNNTMNYRDGQISEFGLLFKKPGSKWAFAAGLTPYSTIQYDLKSTHALNDTVNARYLYSGHGGINKATLGASRSFTIYKTLVKTDSLHRKDTTIKVPIHQISIGLNTHMFFGALTRENRVEYDRATFYNTKEIAKLSTRGAGLEAGLLYRVRLNKKEVNDRIIGESHLYVGVDYMAGFIPLSATYSEQGSRYVYTSSVEVDAGTTYTIPEITGKMNLPQRIALGVAYRQSNKKWGRYTLAADYKTQNWQDYTLSFNSPFTQPGQMQAMYTLSVGAEYEPSLATNDNLFHRLSYRMGVRQGQTHLNIHNTSITQKAISAGISIPVVRSLSRFHISAEYMTNGTTENQLILEKGFNFMVGFTLTPSERWFYQRKYD